MAYELLDYQEEGCDAVESWIRKTTAPCLVEAATGAGKSFMIAESAKRINTMSKGKHVLCLAPSGELVEQNHEKYLLTGEPASMYSASVGSKCLRHPVVFATPGSFKRVARNVGNRFAAVVVDECHGMTPTVRFIIDSMRGANQHLRVIGMSATPYVMGYGYIYHEDETGFTNGPEQAHEPYFAKKVYTIGADELIARGRLTPPFLSDIGGDHYDTLHLELNSLGKFNDEQVDKAFVGHGRKTAAIVADVVARTKDRHSVMIFAATRQHALEVMASLPPFLSRMVDSHTSKEDRKLAVKDFKARKFKYLVNVGVFTTGFDAPVVDAIALLRATESVGLLQQIIGRGLRLYYGKEDLMLLDYGQNIERHCPTGQIFKPQIKARKPGQEQVLLPVKCPSCNGKTMFSKRPDPDDLEIDEHGYYMRGGKPVPTEHGPKPAHFGRRCPAQLPIGGGQFGQCDYRWTSKECPGCGEPNDIAARYCTHCKGEIVDPNEKLIVEFKQLKRDPTKTQTDEVLEMEVFPTVSRTGKECVRVDFKTPYRSFSLWYMPDGNEQHRRDYAKFTKASEECQPLTVTYRKDAESSFYKALAFNLEADAAPVTKESEEMQ